jgi:hypothetical protein
MHREFEGDATAHAVAEEICSFNLQLSQQLSRILSHLSIGKWSVNVGGMTVCLLLDCDHLPLLRKLGQ